MNTFNGCYLSQQPTVILWSDSAHPKLKAVASITLNGAFAIKDIRIIETRDKTIVQFPNRRKRATGVIVDVAHPVTREAREWIESQILELYRREVAYRDDFDARTRPRFDMPADEHDAPASSCGHPTEEVVMASRASELREAN